MIINALTAIIILNVRMPERLKGPVCKTGIRRFESDFSLKCEVIRKGFRGGRKPLLLVDEDGIQAGADLVEDVAEVDDG